MRTDSSARTGASPSAVVDLSQSYAPPLALGDLAPDWGELQLAYGPSEGDLGVRIAVGASHDVEPDNVLTAAGAAHALHLVALATVGPADEVVLLRPGFEGAAEVLATARAQVKVVRGRFDEGYRLPLAALEDALTPRTRLVSLASPQNPSGVAFRRDELEDLLDLMRRRSPEAVLLVDETFREGAHPPRRVAPSAVHLDAPIVCVGSLSKSHGAPGLRLGWCVTRDAGLMARLLSVKRATMLSLSRIDERIGAAILAKAPSLLDARREHFARQTAILSDWMDGKAAWLEWVEPTTGGFAAFRWRQRERGASPRPFVDAAAAAGVLLAPGPRFADEPDVFRMGFGAVDAETLELALSRLDGLFRAGAA